MGNESARIPARQNVQQTFAIELSRLPGVDNIPGLISFLVDVAGASSAPAKPGTLTDAALRGRLAHFDAHSANEVAAVRKALSAENGHVTVYESWSGVNGCLQFWHGFIGSQIRPIAWACEACGAANRDSIGGSVGESFLRRCGCGQSTRITVPKYGSIPIKRVES
jgi:hypothetical protein